MPVDDQSAGCAGDSREHLSCILPLALGFDQNAGIEDQSHAGGLSGSRWLSIAASTSLAKSASMTAVESSGKSAMHSEIVRRGGAGAWITATATCRSRSPPRHRRAPALARRRSYWRRTEALHTLDLADPLSILDGASEEDRLAPRVNYRTVEAVRTVKERHLHVAFG